MLTAIAIAEAVGATGAFLCLAFAHGRLRARYRYATWKADTFESMLARKKRREDGTQLRDEKGRFA